MHAEKLTQLVEMSHHLGRPELGLAILGEGNTSALLDEGTFLVKGSGSQLATIRTQQFAHVRVQPVLDMLAQPNLAEQQIDAALRAALCNAADPKPSIETMLHALCLTSGGAKFVGHTHPEAVNAILCSRLGAEPFLRHIFPDAIVMCGRIPLVVPYVDPGLPLAIAFRDALQKYRDTHQVLPKLVLMINHGVIALGPTAKDVVNTTLMAQKWARILGGALAVGGAAYLSDQSVRAIDGRLDEHYRRQLLRGT